MGGSSNTYFPYCTACGKPYPWQEKQLRDARATIALQAQIEDWDAASLALAKELVSDIAKDRATPSRFIAAADWLGRLGFQGGKDVLFDSVKAFGSEALRAAVKAHFNLP